MHPRVGVADVEVGDILCVHQRRGRNWQRMLIWLWETLSVLFKKGVGRRKIRGSTHVYHAAVVTAVDPYRKQVVAVSNSLAVGYRSTLSFGPGADNGLNPNATYCFYRLRDRDIANRAAKLADRWSPAGKKGLYDLSAVLSAPFRSLGNGRRAHDCIRRATWALTPPSPGSDYTREIRLPSSCSSFVAYVIGASAVGREIEQQDPARSVELRKQTKSDSIRKLVRDTDLDVLRREGPVGRLVDLHPRFALPTDVHRRLLEEAASPQGAVQIVGYIPGGAE